MSNRIILTALLCLGFFASMAQRTITGVVLDSETKESIIGANVLEVDTKNGTITGVDGTFSLNVSDNAQQIEISYFGNTKKIILSNESSYTIELQTGEELDEVVVTALGLERSSKKLGYAVQQLDNKDIADIKSANMVQGLAGKIPGVVVSQGATGVGSTSKITIRGEASFTNNNPLFVIDGTPISNNSILNFTNEAAAGFQEVDFGNGAMDVNQDDIESISVLKGPSAAALYGTRASNGVILITTKTGQQNKGIGVEFNSSFSVETPFQLPEFQNQYGQGNSGEFEFVDGLGGGINDNITYSWGPQLDAGLNIPQFDSPVILPDGRVVRGGDVAVHGGAPITPSPFVSHPDNLRDFYETGTTITNNLAFGSAFERGSFRVSLTDFRNESIIPGTNLDRQTVNTRLQFKPIEGLEINSSLQYINSSSDNRPSGGYGSENINYSLVAWGPRSLDTEVLKDYWQPGLEGIEQYSFNYTFFDNPYFILKENRNAFDRDRVFGHVSAKYTFNENWNILVNTGLDLLDENRTFRRAFSTNRFANGAYAEHSVGYREQNSALMLNYNQRISDFNVDVTLGANRLDQTASSRQLQTVALAQAGIFSLANAAAPIEAFSFDSQKRINSLFGVVKLDYDDWIFLEVTGRNDWSSALATPQSADNTGFFYPSFSSSFVLSEKIELPTNISFAKVRASWAQVGNDTNPYQTSSAFEAQTPFATQPTFSGQSTIANNSLLPEKTSAVELGADVRFFDDRIRFDVTYYNALTENQIIALPVTISTGYDQRVINGGEVRSEGVEILLGATPVYTPKFRWNTLFNFSQNRTTVESLPDEIEGRLTLAYSRVYDNVNQTVWLQVEEGGRVGDLYGTGYLKDDAGNFIIDDNGRYIVDNTLIKLGNNAPDFTVGWNNQFQFGKWDFNFLIDWRQGGVLVSRTQALAGVAGQLIETVDRPEEGIIAEGVVNIGTAEAPDFVPNTTAVGAESYYRQFYDRNHEENNTFNASYVKLREFALGYTLNNTDFFSNGRSLRISLFGRNLFAFSEIPHIDPEQLAVQGNTFVSGVEDMSYATSRSLGIKLSVQF